jgi:hypothetical protein
MILTVTMCTYHGGLEKTLHEKQVRKCVANNSGVFHPCCVIISRNVRVKEKCTGHKCVAYLSTTLLYNTFDSNNYLVMVSEHRVIQIMSVATVPL